MKIKIILLLLILLNLTYQTTEKNNNNNFNENSTNQTIDKNNNEILTLRLERIDPKTGEIQKVFEDVPSRKIGVIVMDVWDQHWCKSWTNREAALIPKMNEFLNIARENGIHIIFSPSDVANFYNNYLQRKAVLEMPELQEKVFPSVSRLMKMPSEQRVEYKNKKYFHGTIYEARNTPDLTYEGYPPLPPFAHTGGCECGPSRPCVEGRAWTSQNKDLVIAENDFIVEGNSQNEIVNLCEYLELTHLFYIGGAGNMCLTWTRENSMINMANRGLKPIILEDLILSISGSGYNPDTKQIDNTFTPEYGDSLVLSHLKKFIAPSSTANKIITSLK